MRSRSPSPRRDYSRDRPEEREHRHKRAKWDDGRGQYGDARRDRSTERNYNRHNGVNDDGAYGRPRYRTSHQQSWARYAAGRKQQAPATDSSLELVQYNTWNSTSVLELLSQPTVAACVVSMLSTPSAAISPLFRFHSFDAAVHAPAVPLTHVRTLLAVQVSRVQHRPTTR